MLMPHRYRLRIEIAEEQRPDGALGLLLPLPPTTPDQEMIQIKLDPTWSTEPCRAEGGVQLALFASVPNRSLFKPIEFEMVDSGRLMDEQFALDDGKASESTEDVRQAFAALGLGADGN